MESGNSRYGRVPDQLEGGVAGGAVSQADQGRDGEHGGVDECMECAFRLREKKRKKEKNLCSLMSWRSEPNIIILCKRWVIK